MSLLVVALFRGNEEGWGSALIVSLFAGAALLLAAFIAIEARVKRPLLDLELFRRPTTAGASIAILVTATSVFAMLTFLVLYIQNTLGYTPSETGLRLLPLTVAFVLRRRRDRPARRAVRPRILIALGLALAGAGLLLNLHGEPTSDWTALLAGGLRSASGCGVVNPSVAAAALGAAPVAKSGMASGLNSTFRPLGVAVGVAALGAIVESEVSASLTQSLGTAPPGLVDAVATGNIKLAVAAAPPELAGQVGPAAKEAFVSGLHTIFVVAAVIAFAGSVLSLLLVRDRDIEPEPVGEPESRPEPGAGPLAA